jgi:23S rRNA maturation-related 3'-5' exoribonuclease YhaM
VRIFPVDKNCIIIDTPQGSVHVYQEENQTKIYYHDHFTMKIRGTHKKTPTIIIDSDEYPTKLIIDETESQWKSLVCYTKKTKWRELIKPDPKKGEGKDE